MFKLFHAWNILKDFPKWQDIHQSSMARSSQHIEDDVVSLDDDESMTVPTPRQGQKDEISKRQQRKRGG
jgi:hypothetical protein